MLRIALHSMCDASLGRILDFMDAHDLWKDTLLIVNTDHGFLLGEHGCWAKCWAPFYDDAHAAPLRTGADRHARFPTALYDLQTDPGQQQPIQDAAVEARLAGLMAACMAVNDAPPEQFQRLGLEPIRRQPR